MAINVTLADDRAVRALESIVATQQPIEERPR